MIFLWVIWLRVLITIIIDIFRSQDLSGWAKALWFVSRLVPPADRGAGVPNRPRRQDA